MIINGECLEVMRTYKDNHFSGIVTDPPYGLHFMGKDWDKFSRSAIPDIQTKKNAVRLGKDTIESLNSRCSANANAGSYDESRNDEFQCFMTDVAIEALRICKPGSMLLMFGAPRRFHRQVCALEDAGWEIRDQMCWLFGSGFPKSHNFGRKMGGEWSGFGSALKPAWEPIIVAMKPLDGTFIENASKWGVAGINIEASRIGLHDYSQEEWTQKGMSRLTINAYGEHKPSDSLLPSGRWPSNLLLDEEAAQQLDQMSGFSKQSGEPIYAKARQGSSFGKEYEKVTYKHADSGGTSRFFYCAKASSSERNEGCEHLEEKDSDCNLRQHGGLPKPHLEFKTRNNHPTVKPLKLMQYLLRMIAPPSGGIILDPFAGSGSTCVAAKRLGIECVGIEKSAEYCEIANARIAA